MKKIFAIFMIAGTLLSFNIITEASALNTRKVLSTKSAATFNNAPIQVRYRYRRYYRPRYIRTYRYYRPTRYRAVRIPRIRYNRPYYTTYRYRTYRYTPRYRRVYVRRY